MMILHKRQRKAQTAVGEMFCLLIALIIIVCGFYAEDITQAFTIASINEQLRNQSEEINKQIPVVCEVRLMTDNSTNETHLSCDCEIGGCEAHYDSTGVLRIKYEYPTPEYIVKVLP